jgi:RNA processing factor Prp31
MENFEEKMVNVIQDRIIKGISNADLIKFDYADRFQVPKEFLHEVYYSLDLKKIKARLIENLENEMADKIANKLITEYSNDIKLIMSNKELREDLRHYAREKIKSIADNVTE